METNAPATAATTSQPAASSTPPAVEAKTKGKAPAPTPKESSAPEAPKKTYKIKTDKQEIEVDEETYHASAQKGFSATKRHQEAIAEKKAALEALNLASQKEEQYNKWKALTPDQKVDQALADLKDPSLTKVTREKIEQWLWNQLQADQATPEQRRLMELEAEKKAWEEEKKTKQEQVAHEQRERAKAQYQQTAQQDVIKIVELAGVPVTEHNFKLAADYLFINAKAKSGATPEQIAEFVKNDTINTTGHLYGGIADGIIKAKESGDSEAILKAGQALLDYMPPQVIKALRILDYTRHMKGIPQAGKQEPVLDVAKSQQKPKNVGYTMSWDEMIAERKARVGSPS